MRAALVLMLFAATAGAIDLAGQPPDPAHWVLEGEALRALHANTLEELLRESPQLRVESYGGAALPFRASAGPWPEDEVLLVVDGLPYRDPWTGRMQVPHLPLALVDKLEFTRDPELPEFGPQAAAGVLRVTTHRHRGRSARAYFHVCPLMIGEPWTTRFSVETPPGGVALAIALDDYDRALSTFSERSGLSGIVPEVAGSQRRALTTRLDLDGGAAGPLSFQLIQSDASFDLSGGPSDTRVDGLYRMTLAAPKTPLGDWLFSQSSAEKSSALRKATDLGLALRWAERKRFLGLHGLSAFAGGRWDDPGWKDEGGVATLPEVAFAYGALRWSAPSSAGFRLTAGLRGEKETARDAGLLYQAELTRPFASRPMRLELFTAGGREREPWAKDRFDSETLWPDAIIPPDSVLHGDFLRGGASLSAFTRDWSWNLGLTGHGSGDRRLLDAGQARWITRPLAPGGAASFFGHAHLGRIGRLLDWSMDNFFAMLGGGRERPAGWAEGSLLVEGAFGEQASTELAYPYRARVGLDYRRSIAEGDGSWRLSSPLEIRWGPDSDILLRWDFTAELRVKDGRIWWRMRDLLHRGGQEIPGYPMPGREVLLGVDWELFN